MPNNETTKDGKGAVVAVRVRGGGGQHVFPVTLLCVTSNLESIK